MAEPLDPNDLVTLWRKQKELSITLSKREIRTLPESATTFATTQPSQFQPFRPPHWVQDKRSQVGPGKNRTENQTTRHTWHLI